MKTRSFLKNAVTGTDVKTKSRIELTSPRFYFEISTCIRDNVCCSIQLCIMRVYRKLYENVNGNGIRQAKEVFFRFYVTLITPPPPPRPH